jgi:hypothetical protein
MIFPLSTITLLRISIHRSLHLQAFFILIISLYSKQMSVIILKNKFSILIILEISRLHQLPLFQLLNPSLNWLWFVIFAASEHASVVLLLGTVALYGWLRSSFIYLPACWTQRQGIINSFFCNYRGFRGVVYWRSCLWAFGKNLIILKWDKYSIELSAHQFKILVNIMVFWDKYILLMHRIYFCVSKFALLLR